MTTEPAKRATPLFARRESRYPAAAKRPSLLATRPMSRRPATRTNGGQSWDAAARASAGRAAAAATRPTTPKPPSSRSERRLLGCCPSAAGSPAGGRPLAGMAVVTGQACPKRFFSNRGRNAAAAGQPDEPYSARRASAVGVRAALRPGSAATRLANARAPMPTSTTANTGTVASGTASMPRANRVHSSRPRAMPSGIPTTAPITEMTVACQATAAASCLPTKPSAFSNPRSRLRRRTEAARVRARATMAPSARPAARMTGVEPMLRVIDDLSGTLHAEDGHSVVGAVGVGGEQLVSRAGNPFHVEQPGRGAHVRPQPDENQLRTEEIRVLALARPESRRLDPGRDERPGAHGCVIGDGAREADRRESGRPHDHERRGRDVERAVPRCPEAELDRVADVLVQLGQRGGPEDDLVVRIEPVPRKHRRGDARMRVLQEHRDVLPVDPDIRVVGAAPSRHVAVAVEDREGLGWDVVGRAERVAPNSTRTEGDARRECRGRSRRSRSPRPGSPRGPSRSTPIEPARASPSSLLEGETDPHYSGYGKAGGLRARRCSSFASFPGPRRPRGEGRSGSRERSPPRRARGPATPGRCRAPSSQKRSRYWDTQRGPARVEPAGRRARPRRRQAVNRGARPR